MARRRLTPAAAAVPSSASPRGGGHPPKESTHFVYMVRCADGTLYTGYARDPAARQRAHNAGRGAKYTAGRRPVALVFIQGYESAGAALRGEQQLKRCRRSDKEALIRRASSG